MKIKRLLLFPFIICCIAYLNPAFGQGDDCGTAVAVGVGMHTADGPAAPTPGTGGASLGCFGGPATDADWYSFTPTTTTDYIITSTNDPNTTDTRLSVYDGSCASLNCIASDDDGGTGFTSDLTVNLTSGTTYYIEWDDRWSGDGFEWEIIIVAPEACCMPNGTCQMELSGDCAGLGGFAQGPGTTCGTVTCPTVPANDECVTADPIVPNGPAVTGNTTLASVSTTTFCGTSATAPGTWYTFVGTGDTATVTSCHPAGTFYDTKISVWEGSCGALVCVDGNDDNVGTNPDCILPTVNTSFNRASTVIWETTAGTNYYIYVHGFSSEVGEYEVTLTTSISTPVPTMSEWGLILLTLLLLTATTVYVGRKQRAFARQNA